MYLFAVVIVPIVLLIWFVQIQLLPYWFITHHPFSLIPLWGIVWLFFAGILRRTFLGLPWRRAFFWGFFCTHGMALFLILGLHLEIIPMPAGWQSLPSFFLKK